MYQKEWILGMVGTIGPRWGGCDGTAHAPGTVIDLDEWEISQTELTFMLESSSSSDKENRKKFMRPRINIKQITFHDDDTCYFRGDGTLSATAEDHAPSGAEGRGISKDPVRGFFVLELKEGSDAIDPDEFVTIAGLRLTPSQRLTLDRDSTLKEANVKDYLGRDMIAPVVFKVLGLAPGAENAKQRTRYRLGKEIYTEEIGADGQPVLSKHLSIPSLRVPGVALELPVLQSFGIEGDKSHGTDGGGLYSLLDECDETSARVEYGRSWVSGGEDWFKDRDYSYDWATLKIQFARDLMRKLDKTVDDTLVLWERRFQERVRDLDEMKMLGDGAKHFPWCKFSTSSLKAADLVHEENKKAADLVRKRAEKAEKAEKAARQKKQPPTDDRAVAQRPAFGAMPRTKATATEPRWCEACALGRWSQSTHETRKRKHTDYSRIGFDSITDSSYINVPYWDHAQKSWAKNGMKHDSRRGYAPAISFQNGNRPSSLKEVSGDALTDPTLMRADLARMLFNDYEITKLIRESVVDDPVKLELSPDHYSAEFLERFEKEDGGGVVARFQLDKDSGFKRIETECTYGEEPRIAFQELSSGANAADRIGRKAQQSRDATTASVFRKMQDVAWQPLKEAAAYLAGRLHKDDCLKRCDEADPTASADYHVNLKDIIGPLNETNRNDESDTAGGDGEVEVAAAVAPEPESDEVKPQEVGFSKKKFIEQKLEAVRLQVEADGKKAQSEFETYLNTWEFKMQQEHHDRMRVLDEEARVLEQQLGERVEGEIKHQLDEMRAANLDSSEHAEGGYLQVSGGDRADPNDQNEADRPVPQNGDVSLRTGAHA